MQIDDLFEDLEAQFEAAENTPAAQLINGKARVALVQDLDLAKHHLVAPVIGLDYVAGLDEKLPIWNLLSFQNVRSLSLSQGDEASLPRARVSDNLLAACLKNMKTPMAAEWKGMGDGAFRPVNIIQVSESMLVLAADNESGLIGVPICRLAHLRILSVDNFGV